MKNKFYRVCGDVWTTDFGRGKFSPLPRQPKLIIKMCYETEILHKSNISILNMQEF